MTRPAGGVGKTRRIARFCLADGRAVPAVPGLTREPGCAAELTEIRMAGQAWWSLGFEATGPAGLLGSALRDTAALVLAHDMPGGADSPRATPSPTRSGWRQVPMPRTRDAARSHAEPRALGGSGTRHAAATSASSSCPRPRRPACRPEPQQTPRPSCT